MPKCRYCKKNFRTNKSLEMHIFQVHERRGTKVDKINVDWEKTKYVIKTKKVKKKILTFSIYNFTTSVSLSYSFFVFFLFSVTIL